MAALRLTWHLLIAFYILLIFFTDAAAGDDSLSDRLRSEVIDSIAQMLDSVYPYADVGVKMVDHLRKNLTAGAYDHLNSKEEFYELLTNELRDISGDLHIQISYEPDEYFEEEESEPTEAMLRDMFEEYAYDNFGFERVERLPGNIGYIKMHRFHTADWAGPTAVAALNFIGHCGAVIFDLRNSLGGSPTMNQLLLSYFFDEPVHFSSFRYRAEDSLKQFWSHAFIVGPRLSKADMYMLINRNTVSAAEEFAYSLKSLGKATIVGQTTRGAANPASDYVVPHLNLLMSIPYGYAENPVTKTNWEGTGVKPDIEADPEEALDIAYMRALNELRGKCTIPARCSDLDWAIIGLQAKMHPVNLSPEELGQYIGQYGNIEFGLWQGNLIIRKSDSIYIELEPMGNEIFRRPDLEFIRYQFLRDEEGSVNGVALLIYGGKRREILRDK